MKKLLLAIFMTISAISQVRGMIVKPSGENKYELVKSQAELKIKKLLSKINEYKKQSSDAKNAADGAFWSFILEKNKSKKEKREYKYHAKDSEYEEKLNLKWSKQRLLRSFPCISCYFSTEIEQELISTEMIKNRRMLTLQNSLLYSFLSKFGQSRDTLEKQSKAHADKELKET